MTGEELQELNDVEYDMIINFRDGDIRLSFDEAQTLVLDLIKFLTTE